MNNKSDSDKITAKYDCRLYTIAMSHSLVFLNPKHSHFQAWLNKGKEKLLLCGP